MKEYKIKLVFDYKFSVEADNVDEAIEVISNALNSSGIPDILGNFEVYAEQTIETPIIEEPDHIVDVNEKVAK